MNRFTIVTPSHGPDLERCRLLAESVARYASADFRQAVIVPRRDLRLFASALKPFGVSVLAQEELLPGGLFSVPFSRKWQLSYRGWPVRGWIRQQVIKLAYAAHSCSDAVVFLDSDVCLIRAYRADAVMDEFGRVRLLAIPGRGNLPGHFPWHRLASRLLGLAEEDYHGYGYIGVPAVWKPAVVRQLLHFLDERHGGDWRHLLLHQRTLSEYILYGVFVQKILGLQAAGHVREEHKRTLEYWSHDKLSIEKIHQFLAGVGPQHQAVLLQSKACFPFSEFAQLIRARYLSD